MSRHLAHYLTSLHRTQHGLSDGFRALRRDHPREPDLRGVCERLAAQCRDHAERLEPFLRRYRTGEPRLPELPVTGIERPRQSRLERVSLERVSLEALGREAARVETARVETARVETAGHEPGHFEAVGRDRAGLDVTPLDVSALEVSGPGAARRPRTAPAPDGGLGLLRDLHGLYLLATECDLSWSVVAQAARGIKDDGLLDLARHCAPETAVHLLWLRTRMRQTAPQVLVVASW